MKTERFALKMKDNVEVRNLREFRNNFEIGRLLDYFGDGTLAKWLESWRYVDEAAAVRAVDKSDPDYRNKLCAILGVDTEEMKRRRERLERLKQFTSDITILQNVDNVAFDTAELYDLLDAGVDEIYLCNDEFEFSSGVLHEHNKHYHGVGNATIYIEATKPIDFAALGITFENIKFNDEYNKLISPQKVFNKVTTNNQVSVKHDGIAIIYWSGTGNTEAMANAIFEGVSRSGASVLMRHVDELNDFDIEELSNYRGLIFGCPAMGDESLEEDIFEPFFSAAEDYLNGVPVMLFGSWGWGGGAWMESWVERTKATGAKLFNNGLIVENEPDDDALAECRRLGEDFAKWVYNN